MDCFTPTCIVGNLVGNKAGTIVSEFAKQMVQLVGRLVTPLGTAWINIPTANLTTGGASHTTEPATDYAGIEKVLGYVTWIGFALAILALLMLAASIAVHLRRGEGIAAAGRLGAVLLGVALIASATSVVAKIMPTGAHGVGGATAFLQSALWWYAAAGATLSVIIAGIRLAWERRAQPGLDLIKSLLTLIVVSAASVTIIWALIRVADKFSTWMLDESLSCKVTLATCFGPRFLSLFALSYGSAPLLTVLLGWVITLSMIIQIILIFIRSGMLVILTGVLPLASSATNTEFGRSWFKKCTGWLVAFILYKPAASIVYAAAFQLVGSNPASEGGTLQMLSGTTMLLIAIFTLPALMKLVAPAVGVMAGEAASGAHIASTAMAAAPTGSLQPLARLGSGSSDGPSAGSTSPSGGEPSSAPGTNLSPILAQVAKTGQSGTQAPLQTSQSGGNTSWSADATSDRAPNTAEATRGRRYSDAAGNQSAAQQGTRTANGAAAASSGSAGSAAAAAGPVGIALVGADAAKNVAHAATAAVKKLGEDAVGASGD